MKTNLINPTHIKTINVPSPVPNNNGYPLTANIFVICIKLQLVRKNTIGYPTSMLNTHDTFLVGKNAFAYIQRSAIEILILF